MYSDSIFFPMLDISNQNFNESNLENVLKEMIYKFIEQHRLSQTAHEEIFAMVHSDKDVSMIFYQTEMKMTKKLTEFLTKNKIKSVNLKEKVHIILHLIDDLCHEIIYHNHKDMNYDEMINIVIEIIVKILN